MMYIKQITYFKLYLSLHIDFFNLLIHENKLYMNVKSLRQFNSIYFALISGNILFFVIFSS